MTYNILNTSVPLYLTQPTHQPPPQRTDSMLVGHATTHPAVRSHRLRETFFSMRCAVCLELTSCVCHRKRLTVCIQIETKTFLFRRSFNQHTQPTAANASEVTALWRFTNMLIIIIIIIIIIIRWSVTQCDTQSDRPQSRSSVLSLQSSSPSHCHIFTTHLPFPHWNSFGSHGKRLTVTITITHTHTHTHTQAHGQQ